MPQGLLELFKSASPKLFSLSCLVFPMKATKVSDLDFPLFLAPDPNWCFLMCRSMMWPVPSSWEM